VGVFQGISASYVIRHRFRALSVCFQEEFGFLSWLGICAPFQSRLTLQVGVISLSVQRLSAGEAGFVKAQAVVRIRLVLDEEIDKGKHN